MTSSGVLLCFFLCTHTTFALGSQKLHNFTEILFFSIGKHTLHKFVRAITSLLVIIIIKLYCPVIVIGALNRFFQRLHFLQAGHDGRLVALWLVGAGSLCQVRRTGGAPGEAGCSVCLWAGGPKQNSSSRCSRCLRMVLDWKGGLPKETNISQHHSQCQHVCLSVNYYVCDELNRLQIILI